MNDSLELRAALGRYTGTEVWFRHPFNKHFIYTEGAKFFFENLGGGAYWLLDILATEPEIKAGVKSEGFAVVQLQVEGGKATLTVSADIDGGRATGLMFARRIEYTTAFEGTWKLYLQYDGEDIVCMVPSEY